MELPSFLELRTEYLALVEMDAYFVLAIIALAAAFFKFVKNDKLRKYIKITICAILVVYFALRMLFAYARAANYELEAIDFLLYAGAFVVFLVPAIIIVLIKRFIVSKVKKEQPLTNGSRPTCRGTAPPSGLS